MSPKLSISSRAPTRVDLAGGTVDLWPLYLFLDRPLTINLGIDLFAEAKLETDPSGSGITLRTEDQGSELKLEWKDLSTFHAPPQLELHLKFLRHFARPDIANGSLTLSTRAKSPAGAGLGGSSTLSIAMIGALATWAQDGKPVDPLQVGEKLIEVARDVETTVIQVPAGVQDYYGAMFGGLQALRWGVSQHRREWLPEALISGLEQRLLLFYSGQSRNSGINNWALFKGFIDRQETVRERFARINAATQKLEKALLAQDWEGAGLAIAEEWETRKTLATGISTAEMNKAFEIARGIAPNSAGKVCGAGGGGCFFIYLPTPELKARVQEALQAEGMRPLPFHPVPRGLEVRVARA